MGHIRAPQVDAELDEIWFYIASESGSPDTADRFIRTLTDCFYLLAENPYMGRQRDDLRPGLRGFPIGSYVILYRIEDSDVLILHVLHGRCDIDRIFRE